MAADYPERNQRLDWRSGTFLLFITVGAIATACQYLILVFCVEMLGWPATFSSTVGFCLAAIVNYWLNYHVTFASRASHTIAAWRFVVVVIVGLLINTGMMLSLLKLIGLHYLLSQVLATCLTLSWSFTASRRWAFRES